MLAGRVGDDPCGRIVAEMLREYQIDISALQVTAGADTMMALPVEAF